MERFGNFRTGEKVANTHCDAQTGSLLIGIGTFAKRAKIVELVRPEVNRRHYWNCRTTA